MTVSIVVRVILYILLGPIIGGLLEGLDRKISARMQGRQGPPITQPFYDLYKLFNKQTIVVNSIQVLFIGAYLIFTVFTGSLFFGGGDLLLIVFSLSMSEVMLVLAAYSVNGPYSAMGAQRELLQMMCYEPMMLLLAIGFYVSQGSFMVNDLIRVSRPAVIALPGMLIGFAFVLIIKLRKSPFDLSTSHHAHQEMVKGLTTDISGRDMGLVELAEWYDTVMMMGFMGLFFVTKNPLSYIGAVIACFVVFFLLILIDNTHPRVKAMRVFGLSWLVILVCAGTNLLILNLVK